ncbi:MAG: hypothetical protein RLZZ522_2156 [Verrucomicrobiota bacterium]
MTLPPDDPRLTAYLLGELPPGEAAGVAAAAAADPALALALQELQSVQNQLSAALAPAAAALLPHQRHAIIRAARYADQVGRISHLTQPATQARWWQSLLVPLAIAAGIALGAFFLLVPRVPEATTQDRPLYPIKAESPFQISFEVALLPAPGPLDASASATTSTAALATSASAQALARHLAARDLALAASGDSFLQQVAETLRRSPSPPESVLPPLTLRGSVPVVTTPFLPLPVHSGRASLSWISHAICTDRQLPPPNAVRLEEILNNFNLRLVGTAAISQGVSIATEVIPCPWKSSATLLLVSIRGAANASREVSATFRADPAAVALYRLLGFAPITGIAPGALPTRLPAKVSTALAIEIEPSVIQSGLGNIEWSVDGKPAAPIELTCRTDVEPSDDARFGALLCAFGQWLARDQAALVNSELLAALARESASPSLAPERTEALALIDQALKLRLKRN